MGKARRHVQYAFYPTPIELERFKRYAERNRIKVSQAVRILALKGLEPEIDPLPNGLSNKALWLLCELAASNRIEIGERSGTDKLIKDETKKLAQKLYDQVNE